MKNEGRSIERNEMKNEMKIRVGNITQLTVGNKKVFYKNISNKVVQFITVIYDEEIEGPATPLLRQKIQMLEAASQEDYHGRGLEESSKTD